MRYTRSHESLQVRYEIVHTQSQTLPHMHGFFSFLSRSATLGLLKKHQRQSKSRVQCGVDLC
jgi:hypothetical protein